MQQTPVAKTEGRRGVNWRGNAVLLEREEDLEGRKERREGEGKREVFVWFMWDAYPVEDASWVDLDALLTEFPSFKL